MEQRHANTFATNPQARLGRPVRAGIAKSCGKNPEERRSHCVTTRWMDLDESDTIVLRTVVLVHRVECREFHGGEQMVPETGSPFNG